MADHAPYPLANRNFRLLWLGENVSLLGDQFYLVALPWLVFDMTSSSLAFGSILMVAGVPRAVLMLVGGVITDRFSPRRVMIVSNLLRLGITVLLTSVIAAQAVQLWMLFVIAFCFGLVDAFFHPAYRAMVPAIVDEKNLKASNSLMLGAAQLIQSGGPGLAGVLVHAVGTALSFAFDALTFLFTSVMLTLMSPAAQARREPEPARKKCSVLGEIVEMLRFVRCDSKLTMLIVLIAAVNLLFSGPLIVGSATLGKVRFVEGAAAFGAMLSVFSVGMLIGTFSAGLVHSRHAGTVSLTLLAVQGLLLIGVGHSPTLIVACLLFGCIGIAAGFGNVNVITITQKRVSKAMMGRFMSLVVLAEFGLTPISNALAGILADLNVTLLFTLAGGLLTLTVIGAAMIPGMRSLDA